MLTFRAYLLNPQGNIVWGDWIEAKDETEARAKAQAVQRDATALLTACGLALRSFD